MLVPFWDSIDSSIKIAVAASTMSVLLMYSVWKYWHWSRFEQPLNPVSGTTVELGKGGEQTCFDTLQEVVQDPQEAQLSAHAALEREYAAREAAKERNARIEAKIQLRNRAKKLVPSGAIVEDPNYQKPSFMIEMYKPLDKDRVYEIPGKKRDKAESKVLVRERK